MAIVLGWKPLTWEPKFSLKVSPKSSLLSARARIKCLLNSPNHYKDSNCIFHKRSRIEIYVVGIVLGIKSSLFHNRKSTIFSTSTCVRLNEKAQTHEIEISYTALDIIIEIKYRYEDSGGFLLFLCSEKMIIWTKKKPEDDVGEIRFLMSFRTCFCLLFNEISWSSFTFSKVALKHQRSCFIMWKQSVGKYAFGR